MEIMSAKVTDKAVLELFSKHDDYMIDFLGEDKDCYTRYSESEKIEQVWVAFFGSEAVGCVAYRNKETGVGEVKRLFVKSEYCGKGIPKELLKAVELYAKKQGNTILFLDTRITLEPAVSIYRSFGFDIVFRQGLYIQMEKNI